MLPAGLFASLRVRDGSVIKPGDGGARNRRLSFLDEVVVRGDLLVGPDVHEVLCLGGVILPVVLNSVTQVWASWVGFSLS